MNKQERLKELLAEGNALEARRTAVWAEYKALKDSIIEAEFPEVLTPEYILTTDHSMFDCTKNYKKTQAFMEQFPSLAITGYHPDVNRNALQIRMNKRQPVEKQIEDIKQFVPHVCEIKVKRVDTKDGYFDMEGKLIAILEPDCAASGIYNLFVSDGKYMITNTYYGRTKIKWTFDTLEQALTNIHKHLGNE